MPAFPATPAFAADSSIREYVEGAAQTFKLGAAVVLTAQLIVECGADPASILGFAQHAAGKNIPATKDLVAVASEGQKFWMAAGTAYVAADIGVSFGIVKDANGIWVVDRTETVNTRVYLHYVDLERQLALVSVLAANRQAAP